MVLASELAKLGSVKALAKKYFVSEATIKTLFKVELEVYVADALDLFKKVGSVKFVHVIYDDGQPLKGFDNVEKVVPSDGVSKTSFFLGRKGEQDYMQMRRLPKECDHASVDPNHPFDIMDPEHGRVNVKSSDTFKYKQGSLPYPVYYKFSLKGLKACDRMSFQCYKNGVLVRWYIIPAFYLRVYYKDSDTLVIDWKNTHKFIDFLVDVLPEGLMRILRGGKIWQEVLVAPTRLGPTKIVLEEVKLRSKSTKRFIKSYNGRIQNTPASKA